ncbi:MAG: PKD domain-containing protein [Methanoregula sp.]|nr:PKD domain-containing protein [Methanoregula sp.]
MIIPAEDLRNGRRSPGSKNRLLIATVMIFAFLLLNVAVVAADNSTDVNVSNSTPQATLVPDTTLITAVPTETARPDITRLATAVEQYTLRTSKQVTQEQREAAAANYQKLREAYLMQGTLEATTGGLAQAPMAGAGAPAPVMDPGGIPHYFGPFPNYANSPMPRGSIVNITVDTGGQGYTAPVVTVEDVYFTGTGATATAFVAGGAITSIMVTNPGTNYTAPVVVITDGTGSGAAATAVIGGPFNGGIRKFVDTLPGLNAGNANNLGQYIPVAIPEILPEFPNDDYYEIELGEYSEKLHSDLPPTTLRGYRQTNTADPTVSQFHNLGPLIIADTDRPVRIKFTNSLPTGAGGNLFIPVDKTVMGAGMGPQGMNVSPIYYTENRAEIHLHGGNTPWISDGTPHQWITPAGEDTAYPRGVAVYNVPDMPDPGDGSVTLYYTNQQSARLMFYHDHAHGLTRLNVYAGEAGAYLLTDQVEKDMIEGTNVAGVNPGGAHVLPDTGIPLVVQDKTFVDNTTIAAQDPTWNWGTNPGAPMTGDLWYPHVYMPAQNPYDDTGVNPYGRWHYGPWFWPPTNTEFGPVANVYAGQPGEPPMVPGTPNPSMAMEAFMDTALVNGALYPNMTVEPRAYRFRVLNAADDRFFNLQLYVADPDVTTADGRNNTEVRIVPAVPTAGFPADWPTDGREEGVPDPAMMGPSFIQIGTEGGFLPAPVVVPNQPITWVTDPTVFNAGNVDKHALLLAPAERADVIVDFSDYPGQTLILYNDGPAAFPARIPQYDYYTGAPDLTSTGGVPTIQAGYAPNTRTVMQIKVANITPAAPYDLAALEAVFAKTAGKRGVFEVSQPPIIVPQVAYNSAYDAAFTQNNYARIADRFKNFTTISGTPLNISFQPKAIQDEMGEAFDEYGRMSGFLGLQTETRPGQQTLLLYGYNSPPLDVMMESLGAMSEPQPGDGTQIWKITHNGVDTHPVHWHLFNVQVINRVGWDGFIRPPEATELGWKETLRVSPLEDTIVAMRPVAPTLPFDVPNSVRPIDPSMPLGAPLAGAPGKQGFADPAAQPITVFNHLINEGWEYVFHCHILAHEEMDMMHTENVALAPGGQPSGLISGNVLNSTTNTTAVYLAWTDNSIRESDWTVQRANLTDALWYDLMRVPSYTGPQTGDWAMAIDGSIPPDTDPSYQYRVLAVNVVGDDAVYPASDGFPVIALNSTSSDINVSQIVGAPDQASFTYTPASGDAPLTVAFTDTSDPVNTTGWDWDFGDGNFGADNGKQHPAHVYQLPGIYTVTLTAMSLGGNATSTSSIVTVTKEAAPTLPVADFTATPTSGPAPLTVAFDATASTSNPAVWATWRWTFGDGTFSSLKNPTHTYGKAGNYTVTLAATNLGGTGTVSHFVDVKNASMYSVGLFRNSTHMFYLKNGTQTTAVNWGLSTDTPVTGDWNGDGLWDVGVFRNATHTFYLKNGTKTTAVNWGLKSDQPVTGRWS